MTGSSVRIGSLFGIPIRIHVTFLIVLPFLAVGFGRVYTEAARLADVPADALGGTPFLWGLVVALALFGSVLVHELAHSVYALRRGGRVRDITLLMVGGVSQITEPPRGGKREAIMALAGPATSLALGAAFYGLFRAMAGTAHFDLKFGLFHLAYMNVALGLFNLLPAFPMDGGRILRGVLMERWGLLRATRVAAAAGKAFAILFAILGFLSINILLMVVAFFVWFGADAENRGVLVKALLGHVRVRDLLRGGAPPVVDPAASVLEVAERMVHERRLAFAVAAEGRVLGVAVLEDVQRVPPGDRGRTRIGDVARRVEPIEADAAAFTAVRALADGRTPVVPVLDRGGLVGLLSQTDLARGLQLTELESTLHAPPPDPPRPAVPRGHAPLDQHA